MRHSDSVQLSGDTQLHILTLVIGADYRKALEKCLESKRSYAEKHGYVYIQGDEQFWDRTKPIAWSKIPFILSALQKIPEGALVWLSDADVLITNPSLKVETQMLPHLPSDKDFLWTQDACGNINSGNCLFRNTSWARDFWKRVGEQKQFTYHIWWENAGMIYLMQTNQEDAAKMIITKKHKLFNAYVKGLPNEPLWEPGDFLVHFAGVYDLKIMDQLATDILNGKVPRLSLR